MSEKSDREKDAQDELIRALRSSTSGEMQDLEIVEINSETVLHFFIKKETLLKKMSDKLTGKHKDLKQEQKMKASAEVLEKGVWIEIEVDNAHFWLFLEARCLSTATQVLDYSCIFYTDQDKNSEILGSCTKQLTGLKTCEIFMPRMQFVLTFVKGSWEIMANCVSTVVVKSSQGLVCLVKGKPEDVDASGQKIYCCFDDSGAKFLEESGDLGADSIIDMREVVQVDTNDWPVSFYRGGSEPFVCFDVQNTPYTRKKG